MDKKNKGLADNHDGDIILNESGTSVSFGWDAGENDETSSLQDDEGNSKNESSDKDDEGLISQR